MPETRFQRWLRLSALRLSTQQQQQQQQGQQQLSTRRPHEFCDINSMTKWLLYLQSIFQQVNAYHCLYKSIRDIGNDRSDIPNSESIFHLLICTGTLLSLIVDFVSVTSNKLSVADSRHWPVGVYFFVLSFLDQLLKATNIFINGTKLQKECGDRILGPHVGGALPPDHFVYAFCEMRREVTQIWSLLGFFVQVLMSIMYSTTASVYATHRVSVLTRRQNQQQQQQQQQSNNANIPLYNIPDHPPVERRTSSNEPNTPTVPAPPYTCVDGSELRDIPLNR